MTFPHINVKATNYTVTPKLETLLDQKFMPLGKLLDDRNEVLCEVELEKVAEHQSGKIYRAEVNLTVNGKLFRTEATEEEMEQAIDSARNDLKAELQRANGRRHSLVRKGGQMLKDMIRSGK
ncbi:ribosome-associated translation inhibitor RaiA [Candidatus Kaiserbacteria bacterium]|nr:MAG: ribosome-associated translation inhibitor RaiA [Candidatus Kaiserbacteria bacterium]